MKKTQALFAIGAVMLLTMGAFFPVTSVKATSDDDDVIIIIIIIIRPSTTTQPATTQPAPPKQESPPDSGTPGTIGGSDVWVDEVDER